MSTVDVNLVLRAPGQFTNYNFNSYANFNGKQLAASANGLYQVCCGDDDDGTDIDAYFTLGPSDLGISNPKRVDYVYANIDSSSDMTLKVNTDDKYYILYDVLVSSNGLQRDRVRLAKGARGWYWKWTFSNVDGADFEVNSIQIMPILLSEGVK